MTEQFLHRQRKHNGLTIPYRLFVPENYDSEKEYPLLLTLHGSGERGSDNNIQIERNFLATAWAQPEIQEENPCFIVSPQCPVGGDWVDGYFGYDFLQTPIRPELEIVLMILNDLQAEYTIDASRIYVTGVSMGGFGTFDILMRAPDLFAAAIPVCGGGDSRQISLIDDIPMWLVHGENDQSVPVENSRAMVSALQNNGVTVTHTHCDAYDCNGLTEQEAADAVSFGVRHFYSEIANAGHDVWTFAYHYQPLLDWLFLQGKQIDEIAVSIADSDQALSGEAELTWQTVNAGGQITLAFSPDAGGQWTTLASAVENTGSFLLDTSTLPDCAFGLVSVLQQDEQGTTLARGISEYLAIDNENENGAPFFKLLSHIDPNQPITGRTLEFTALAGDPEGDSLILTALYAVDASLAYQFCYANKIASTREKTRINIDVSGVANAPSAYIAIIVNDGKQGTTSSFGPVMKMTDRKGYGNSTAMHTAGNATASWSVNRVTTRTGGASYEISFDDLTSPDQKFITVSRIDEHELVIDGEKLKSGVESSRFGPFRFYTYDTPTINDLERSEWENTDYTLDFLMNPFFLSHDLAEMNGYAYPADYRIAFFNEAADTSLADTLETPFATIVYEAQPVNFTVTNLHTGRQANFNFSSSGQLSKTYTIVLNEPVAGKQRRTWRINLYGTLDKTELPVSGALFLATQKGVSHLDTIQVTDQLVGLSREESLPQEFRLLQNYPNPFNPSTMIMYELSEESHARLSVYDVLGRQVKVLQDGRQHAGAHSVSFNPEGLAAGIYFYRLTVQDFSMTKKMVFLK